jgi:two-component system phosphate regulon sensor histidine kinase PhoR
MTLNLAEIASLVLLTACLVLTFLYFTFRRKLGRLEQYAKKMASGKEVSMHYEAAQPFRNLARDIETLASTLGERVQTASEEKKRLFAILESMTEGVLAVDTEQKVLFTNSALEKSFGLEKSSAQGRYFWEIFRDADINEMIEKGLGGRAVARKEHAALLTDSVFEIEVSPVSAAGEFLGVVAVFRDITLLKEFERLRTEFVANVSHELKTPLTSILGFVETLKEGGIDDPENRMKFLQIIETQSKKLHALIEDLLLLSKIESAKEPLRLEEVDVERLFEKMKDVFLPILKEKNIQMQMVSPAKTVRVNAEASSLERALSNLIDNALKYNRSNGLVTLQALDGAKSVVLEVRDTGIGIEPEDLARVFERFYRADKSRSRESGGTGLGLSIAKHIVERHGGRIEVQSTPGKGSTFSIVLPR